MPDKDVAPLVGSPAPTLTALRPDGAPAPGRAESVAPSAWGRLEREDPHVAELLLREDQRQRDTLPLIAAENECSAAVRAALGSVVQNKTTEGFAGGRFHGGCEVVDALETLACERACAAFGARYANVQPHSGTSANHIVFAALLGRDDRILSLGLDQGGHVSHGAPVSLAGRLFAVDTYHVDRRSLRLDYDAIHDQARRLRPRLIVCGASAYPRVIDFARFRAIADEVGAWLLADISHIAGLVIAGLHPSPINAAHVTTTSTYKPGGPRGGLILAGHDADRPVSVNGGTRPLAEHLDKTTFPGVQGTPQLNNVAAKAVFLRETLSEGYHHWQRDVVANAQALAAALQARGFTVLTGGTDTHMVLVDVTRYRPGLTGIIAQRCLEDCGIMVNMNRLPYDPHSQAVTSGIRLGTPIVTRRGLGPEHLDDIAAHLATVLDNVQVQGTRAYALDPSFRDATRQAVRRLCRRFPPVDAAL